MLGTLGMFIGGVRPEPRNRCATWNVGQFPMLTSRTGSDSDVAPLNFPRLSLRHVADVPPFYSIVRAPTSRSS